MLSARHIVQNYRLSESTLRQRCPLVLAEELAREFHASWKGAIGTIADGVQRHVENPHNNTELLKQVLTQLLLYYTRFQDILRTCWQSAAPFDKYIVTTSTILHEIKKFSS